MVSAKIVSRFTGELPLEGTCLKISNGPLYPAEEVLALLTSLESQAQAIRAWTTKCAQDMQKWGIDADGACELIKQALRIGHFLGSEWCIQRPDGPWAACDAYSLVRREWIQHAYRELNVEYYTKFAIAKSGKILLVISCHPSEDRR